MSRFDTDTAVEMLEEGRYRAHVEEGWWTGSGPNGGYVGAILERALAHAVGDPTRACRSFTVHYLSPPAAGVAELDVTVEREGRSLTSASVRLSQAGRPLAIAVAAYSRPRPGPAFCDAVMPSVPGPEESSVGPFTTDMPPTAIPAMAERYRYRWALGPPAFSGGDEALTGGWIRLAEPRPLDPALLIAYVDAWMPALFGRVTGRWGITTVDLTVHVRELPEEPYDDWCFLRFRSVASADGFCEEDGEVWSRDGRLLAQSRQLAAILGTG